MNCQRCIIYAPHLCPDCEKPSVRPPIGLSPEYVWRWSRVVEISRAIVRYEDASKTVPREWVDEMRVRLMELAEGEMPK